MEAADVATDRADVALAAEEYAAIVNDWPTQAETLAALRAQEADLLAALEKVRAQISEREAKPDLDVADRLAAVRAIHDRIVASLEKAAEVAVVVPVEAVEGEKNV